MTKKKIWSEKEDNDTLIKLHLDSQYNYFINRKASYFYKYMNKLFGFIAIISSSIACSVIVLGDNRIQNYNEEYDICNQNISILKTTLGINIFSCFIQNFFNLISISHEYKQISQNYGKYKNIIEAIGDIHPKRRTGSPKQTLPILRYNLNKIKQNKRPIPCPLLNILNIVYSDKLKNTYLKEKHEKYDPDIIVDDEDSDDEGYGIHPQYLDNIFLKGIMSINPQI